MKEERLLILYSDYSQTHIDMFVLVLKRSLSLQIVIEKGWCTADTGSNV